jgi:cell division septation protein DedD
LRLKAAVGLLQSASSYHLGGGFLAPARKLAATFSQEHPAGQLLLQAVIHAKQKRLTHRSQNDQKPMQEGRSFTVSLAAFLQSADASEVASKQKKRKFDSTMRKSGTESELVYRTNHPRRVQQFQFS